MGTDQELLYSVPWSISNKEQKISVKTRHEEDASPRRGNLTLSADRAQSGLQAILSSLRI